jgi:hypothetical protein
VSRPVKEPTGAQRLARDLGADGVTAVLRRDWRPLLAAGNADALADLLDTDSDDVSLSLVLVTLDHLRHRLTLRRDKDEPQPLPDNLDFASAIEATAYMPDAADRIEAAALAIWRVKIREVYMTGDAGQIASDLRELVRIEDGRAWLKVKLPAQVKHWIADLLRSTRPKRGRGRPARSIIDGPSEATESLDRAVAAGHGPRDYERLVRERKQALRRRALPTRP